MSGASSDIGGAKRSGILGDIWGEGSLNAVEMAAVVWRRSRRLFAALWRAPEGNIALSFALGLPGILIFVIGAIDLMSVHTAKSRLQDIADGGALTGAQALALTVDGEAAKERAHAFVLAAMSDWKQPPAYTASYSVVDDGPRRAIHVRLEGNRPSFFVNLLPPGGWKFVAEAGASSVGIVPLCVLITSQAGAKQLNIRDHSRLNAPACMVHSNRDVEVEGGTLAAAVTQAVGKARGAITPAANVGAARIDDPFAALDLSQTKRLMCTAADMEIKRIRADRGLVEIPAGLHCGGIEALGSAVLKLAPGDHFFLGGHLVIKEDARMEGDDVALIFDRESKFEFKDRAIVKLDGRKSGTYAGIVMSGTRDNTQDFLISADHVESLLGVIYVPSAKLIVDGRSDVARDSAWTVVVAKALEMRGSPSLFMNANYAASDVPVPAGVGNRISGAELVR